VLLPYTPRAAVLFVTANLNAGGAQRSLVNLALALQSDLDFEIAVCGNSSSAHFARTLRETGVRVARSAESRDCFDHAEAIVRHMCAKRIGTVCFWNVDAKVKLLLCKALAGVRVRLLDVSPGDYSFEEMDATCEFQEWIAFSGDEYYTRLDGLVMKYRGTAPGRKITVIPNGVPTQPTAAAAAQGGSSRRPRIVMSGRIAPSKFLVEAVAAMRMLWRDHAGAELHVLGSAEARHAAYASALLEAIGEERDVRVFLHGAAFDTPLRLREFDVALVLGENQGSPNAVLEALAAGVPVVANDSGGTRELVIDGKTGVLLPARDAAAISAGLARIIGDPAFARRVSDAGRRHVERHFSMPRMAAAYRKLLAPDREAACSH
jgi:glycosyltransferase involved in cell wall biosynthesis